MGKKLILLMVLLAGNAMAKCQDNIDKYAKEDKMIVGSIVTPTRTVIFVNNIRGNNFIDIERYGFTQEMARKSEVAWHCTNIVFMDNYVKNKKEWKY